MYSQTAALCYVKTRFPFYETLEFETDKVQAKTMNTVASWSNTLQLSPLILRETIFFSSILIFFSFRIWIDNVLRDTSTHTS